MTSNLPVAGYGVGIESAVDSMSGHFVAAVRESREEVEVGGGGALDFASVLAEVMAAQTAAAPAALVAGASREEAPRLADAGTGAARLARALAADAPMQWLAAPLVHRAIDAYRELMNVSA